MLPRKRKKIVIIFVTIFIILLFIVKALNKNTYISKDTKELEWLYNIREQEYTGKTYYVSSDGTSEDGTDINYPMSFENAKSKYYFGGDKILLKRGDTFYGQFAISGSASTDKPILISAYGQGERPIISVAKIISNRSVWENVNSNVYRVDITNVENFSGCMMTDADSCNIGFFTDGKSNIYGDKKDGLEKLLKLGDFFSNEKYFYVYSNGNPTDFFGTIKMAINKHIFGIGNYMEICDLTLEYSSGHAMMKASWPLYNSYIHDCLINYIGGAQQDEVTRYGNGIELYDGAYNVIIENNIIKNVYDAGITLQGNNLDWDNILIQGNIIINTCYPFELWAKKTSTGLKNVKITDNIVINQGRGWAQQVRTSPGVSANHVFYTYGENARMDVYIQNNRYYNSYRLFYITEGDKERFKVEVKNDNNKYYIKDDVYVVNNVKNENIKGYLNSEYNTEHNSVFNYISDPEIEEISNPDILNSNDYDEIKTYYDKFDVKYRNSHATENIIPTIGSIINDEKYTGILQNNEISLAYEELKKAVSNLSQNIDIINVDSVSYSYECLYNFINTIKDKFLNNEINMQKNNFIELVSQLDSVSNEYKDIYSYYITEDNTSVDTIKNTLNNTIDKYNNNLDLDIGYLENIITTAKNLYNNSITTDNVSLNVLNKQRIINITSFANSIIDLKINEFVELEKQKIKVEFDKDTTTPTNENITATLIVGDNTIIKNNGGSNKHIFEKNETFTYELEIKGVIFNVQVTISNINKDYTIEEEYITNIGGNTQILDFKDNLGISNFTFKRDDELVNINEDIVKTGDIITFNNKSYTLIVSGDINSDGGCTIKDIVSYRKYLLKYSEYSNIQFKAADINQDNELTIKDLVGIRELLLN